MSMDSSNSAEGLGSPSDCGKAGIHISDDSLEASGLTAMLGLCRSVGSVLV